MLGEKDLDLAGKDKELVSWVAKATRMQEEIEWERQEREKAQAEAAEVVKKKEEVEKEVAEARVALERAEGVRRHLMESGIYEIVAKIFASNDYVFEVAGLVPKLQATGRVKLLEELQAEYFPDKEI